MQAEQQGRRLVTLRRLLGLSQTELAESTGISQPQISLMERGERSITGAAISQICLVTQAPASFFNVETHPVQGILSFRKLAAASAVSRDSSIARFEEVERISADLAERVGYRLASLPQSEDDIDGDDIEHIAELTRDALGLEMSDPILNLTRSLERRGIVVAPIASKNEGILDGHDGASRAVENITRPVIAYISGTPGDRERFTKAHELGHIVLHGRRPDVGEKIKEREAHRFAGALLLPAKAMEGVISESLSLNGYVALKAIWGVSIQAIIARAHALGLISDAKRKSLMVQVSYKGWRKAEPVEVKPENPVLLRQMLVKTYGPMPYVRASADLGSPARFLREWAPGASNESDVQAPIKTPGDSGSNVIKLFPHPTSSRSATQ